MVPEIEFRNIRKVFGSVTANDGVSFAIQKQSIHGVVGENGAGKSTIMKILYGLYQPDEGELRVRGEVCEIASPDRAISLGIGMVHQHFMLVPTLSVWRNIVLGREPSARLDGRALCVELEALQKSVGFHLDLSALVEDLSVGLQQQVEILKLLYRRSEILILDEPTAVLTPQEVEALFRQLKLLQKQGKTIVLISHKLKEILAFTEFVTVMRQGRVVETCETKALNESQLAEKIIGRQRAKLPARTARPRERTILEVQHLTVSGDHRNKLNDVSFSCSIGGDPGRGGGRGEWPARTHGGPGVGETSL